MNLTFASSKGGVGKTTSCASLGALLAHQGEPTLIFDLDPNQPLARWAEMARIDNLTVHAVKESGFKAAYKECVADNAHRHILIDLPGLDQGLNLKAVSVAHLVIIPAHLSELDLFEAARMVDRIDDVSEVSGRDIPYRLLYTQVRALGPTHAQRFLLEQMLDAGHKRLRSELVQRNVYVEMFINGVPPFQVEVERGAGPELSTLLAEIEETIVAENTPRLKEVV